MRARRLPWMRLTEKGVFLGGTIMPGLHLMHDSLNQHAVQVNIHAGAGGAFMARFSQ